MNDREYNVRAEEQRNCIINTGIWKIFPVSLTLSKAEQSRSHFDKLDVNGLLAPL